MRHLVLAAALAGASAASAADPALPYRLPAKLEGNRFFVEPVTAGGKTLRLYTDTGGGLLFTPRTAEALGVKVEPPNDPQEPAGEVAWPEFARDAWLPKPLGGEDKIPILIPPPRDADYLVGGMLGAPWFADRCWELDYAAGTLRLLPDGALPEVEASHRVKLGFQAQDGRHTMHFARIEATVDGEPLQLLFDTGATSTLTPEALAAAGDGGPAERGSSFITRTVLERWHERHPDWTVVDAGEQGTKMPMIRVPAVDVGGYTATDVWFAQRPDKNFTEWMSQWMDRPIVGALGGSALRGFRVTIDYRSETATFERPRPRKGE